MHPRSHVTIFIVGEDKVSRSSGSRLSMTILDVLGWAGLDWAGLGSWAAGLGCLPPPRPPGALPPWRASKGASYI